MPRLGHDVVWQIAERECFRLHFQVDLRVNVRGVQGDMIGDIIIAPSPDLQPALFLPTPKAAKRVLECHSWEEHRRDAYDTLRSVSSTPCVSITESRKFARERCAGFRMAGTRRVDLADLRRDPKNRAALSPSREIDASVYSATSARHHCVEEIRSG